MAKAARCASGMPEKLANAKMTVKDFVGAENYTYRMTAVRNSLTRSLGYRPLQQPEHIADALALIGVASFWGRLARRLKLRKKEAMKRWKAIVKRRNQIAHEGDLSQARRYRNNPRDIQPGFVSDSLAFAKRLVENADREINAQLGI